MEAYRFACSGEGWQHYVSEAWGPCTRLIEVGDDQLATRQVEIYRSGQVLVYDRACARDRYGLLIGLRFSRKDKWRKFFSDVRLLSEAEFEKAWNEASARYAEQDLDG